MFPLSPPEVMPKVYEVKDLWLFSTAGIFPGTFLGAQELHFDLSNLVSVLDPFISACYVTPMLNKLKQGKMKYCVLL